MSGKWQPVDRSALVSRLESGREAGMTLIEAGVGWGKTQLLRQWARQLASKAVPVTWLDPQTTEIGSKLEQPGVIIVDNLECFSEEHKHRFIAEILGSPPHPAHVAIASRERIHTAGAACWLGEHLLRLGQTDLQFSVDEAQRLFAHSVSPAQMPGITEWSEGWPALLGYLRKSLQAGETLDSALICASHDGGEVSRFIREQVLQPLSHCERELLTRTAFLPSFSADLARVMSGLARPWEVLARLEDGMLITACAHEGDRKRIDYRTHPAIREVLRQDLARRGLREYRRLHANAARSLHSAGDVARAVRCASDADEFTLAARIVLASGGMLYGIQHGVAALRTLLDVLPGRVMRRHPRLALAEAYVLINEGRFDIAREIIDTVGRGLLARQDSENLPRSRALRRDLAIVEIVLATYTSLGSVEEKIELLEAAIEAAEPGELLALGTLNNLLAWLLFRRGYFNRSASRAQCALHYYSRGAAPDGCAYTHLLLGLIDIEQARPDAAIRHYESARGLFRPHARASETHGHELADVLLAEAFYEQGRLSEAKSLCEPAVARICAANYNLLAVAYRTLASLTACERGLPAAEAVFDRGLTLARKQGFAALEIVLDLYRSEIALLGGQAIHVHYTTAAPPETGDWREQDTRLFLRARSAMRAHEREVVGMIERMITDFEQQGRLRRQIDALVLLAVAQLDTGEGSACLRTLANAVRLSAPRGLQRPFIEHARRLAPWLLQLRGQSTNESDIAFIQRVLALGAATTVLTEVSFSERELQVLRLLGYKRENKSIARELRIPPETVRFHLKNVYEKLGIKDRTLVAQIARERGILSGTAAR